MLTATDLLHLPCTPDLTEGGISYACRSLACTRDRLGEFPMDQMRHCVADVAVELAFRRYLREQAVPFHVLGMQPFTHPERYDVSLGGHRCIVKSMLVTRRDQITWLRRDPGSLLQAPALVPFDECAADNHKSDDLYLFAFLLGVVAASQTDLGKAIAAGQPAFLIHLLPEAWARPVKWIPLHKLALKSECGMPVTIEIGGQDCERNYLTAALELPPRQRILVEKDFHSLTYIHVKNKPEARIGIHSPLHGEPYIIPPHAWSNLWIYGMDIILTGWLTHEDFRRKSKVLNTGALAFQGDRTHVKNLQVPVSELNPIGRLLDKVRQWEAEKMAIKHLEMEKHL
jgi:hypothetical protein